MRLAAPQFTLGMSHSALWDTRPVSTSAQLAVNRHEHLIECVSVNDDVDMIWTYNDLKLITIQTLSDKEMKIN